MCKFSIAITFNAVLLLHQHVGSFEGVTSVVRSTLTESLMQLLTPRRRLDILRDVREAQANK